MKDVSNVSIVTRSPRETRALGRAFGKKISAGAILLLRGNLGTGKTLFAKGLALGLGVKKRLKSPSFGILHSYPAANGSPRSGGAAKIKRFYHLDLYRLKSKRELGELGFRELLREEGAVTAVEWPEKINIGQAKNTIRIKFSHGKHPQERVIHVA